MRRFYISPDQIGQLNPKLQGSEARHIRSVLRLRPGAEIYVFDGTGAEFKARIVEFGPDHVTLVILEHLAGRNCESATTIALAQGYLKESKMDQLIPPLTELGISRFIPMIAHRSVPVVNPTRAQNRRQRWEKMTVEAVKQCRRSLPLVVDPPISFQEALTLARSFELKLIFWEKESQGRLTDFKTAIKPKSIFAMVGPEGGFEDAEIADARHHGFTSLGLGPRILKAETAAVGIGVLLQYLFGDMG